MSKSFIEFCVDDANLRGAQKFECKWNSDGTLLAVSTFSISSGGTIKLINEHGILVEPKSGLRQWIPEKVGVKVSAFSWHPKEPILAIGWENSECGVFSFDVSNSAWIEVSEKHSQDNHEAIVEKCFQIEWVDGATSIALISPNGSLKLLKFDKEDGVLEPGSMHQLPDYLSAAIAIPLTLSTSILFMGSTTGIVYQLISSSDTVADIVQVNQGILELLYYEKRNQLVVLTESLQLCQYSISLSDNVVTEVSKVKLSSFRTVNRESVKLKMIDNEIGLIAIGISEEKSIRLWQLETGHNSSVMVVDSGETDWNSLTCFEYIDDILIAATTNCNLLIWRRSSDLEFIRVSMIQVNGNVQNLSIAKNKKISLCTESNEIYFIEEQIMSSAYTEELVVVQVSAKTLRSFWMKDGKNFELITETPIKGLILSKDYLCVKTTGIKEMHIYRVLNGSLQYSKSINIDEPFTSLTIIKSYLLNLNLSSSAKSSQNVSLSINVLNIKEKMMNPSIYPIELKKFDRTLTYARNVSFQSNLTHSILVGKFDEIFAYWIFELNGEKLCVQSGPSVIDCKSEIEKVKMNYDCSFIAFIEGDFIAVVHIETNKIMRYHVDQTQLVNNDLIELNWAINESRLLCYVDNDSLHVLLCSTEEMLIKKYDEVHLKIGTVFLGFQVPNLYFFEGNDNFEIVTQVLPEFDGLNLTTIKILIDFLTSSNLDLNQMIKNIDQTGENNGKLWLNLGRISVKCRDINMGIYCAAKLKDARLVGDIKRELKENSSPNPALALLAINLGLNDEAEELLKIDDSKSFQLSKLYQAQNKWTEAMNCVEKLNAKRVYFDYAKYLENEAEDLNEAIKYYEKSGTSVFEVPKMLFDIDSNVALKNYCLTRAKKARSKENASESDLNESNELLCWWGQYLESVGEIDQAIDAYEMANDCYNLVRLLCYTGEKEKAKAILSEDRFNESNDDDNENVQKRMKTKKEAALLQIGRSEEQENPVEAVNYFLLAGAINHAIRVCKRNNMNGELSKIVINYGTKKDAKEMISKLDEGELSIDDLDADNLAQLYYKCNEIDEAIKISLDRSCWSTLRHMLSEILEEKVDQVDDVDMKDKISDETIEQALSSLRNNSDIIDIIIDLLLLRPDNRSMIVDLIKDYHIEINETLIEKVERISGKEKNDELIDLLANLSLQQGQYILAAKLFNSIGDRVSAVKSLIRSGKEEKIISFANIARDKTVYKITANYLQTINYSDNELIAKFYKKANAKQELERFLSEIKK